jgi:hypothetical protein
MRVGSDPCSTAGRKPGGREEAMRRGIVVATIATALVFMSALAAVAAPPARNCPPPFDLGAVTLQELLALPKHAAGIDAGALTVAGLEALFGYIDHNEDGLVCIKSIPVSPNNSAASRAYVYNIVENAAVGPS